MQAIVLILYLHYIHSTIPYSRAQHRDAEQGKGVDITSHSRASCMSLLESPSLLPPRPLREKHPTAGACFWTGRGRDALLKRLR
ncbi:hypothetical protein BGZ63DRAFT_373657 [Mariannaea sp. PMI_226]|nr:hypothetical protein BGZ63DRAFT_373657 [Mariannaea sp. PMI_226]